MKLNCYADEINLGDMVYCEGIGFFLCIKSFRSPTDPMYHTLVWWQLDKNIERTIGYYLTTRMGSGWDYIPIGVSIPVIHIEYKR